MNTLIIAPNDHLSPHLRHYPLSPHDTLHCLARLCVWQDHHSWKALYLGSSGSNLTLPLGDIKCPIQATTLQKHAF